MQDPIQNAINNIYAQRDKWLYQCLITLNPELELPADYQEKNKDLIKPEIEGKYAIIESKINKHPADEENGNRVTYAYYLIFKEDLMESNAKIIKYIALFSIIENPFTHTMGCKWTHPVLEDGKVKIFEEHLEIAPPRWYDLSA